MDAREIALASVCMMLITACISGTNQNATIASVTNLPGNPPPPTPTSTRVQATAAPSQATVTIQAPRSPTPEGTEIRPSGHTIADVLRPTAECALPCWQGLTPGVSTVGDLQALLQHIAYDPPKIDPGSHGIEGADIALPGVPAGLNGILDAAYDEGVVTEFDLYMVGLAGPGAVEFRQLDELLGAPSSILMIEEFMGARHVILDYARTSLLIRFTDEDLEYGDICLPSESPTSPPDAVFYDPRDRERILEQYGLDAGDWAKWKGVTTEELWRRLQDPTRCIPMGPEAKGSDPA